MSANMAIMINAIHQPEMPLPLAPPSPIKVASATGILQKYIDLCLESDRILIERYSGYFETTFNYDLSIRLNLCRQIENTTYCLLPYWFCNRNTIVRCLSVSSTGSILSRAKKQFGTVLFGVVSTNRKFSQLWPTWISLPSIEKMISRGGLGIGSAQ